MFTTFSRRPLDHLLAIANIHHALAEITATSAELVLSDAGRDGLAALFAMLEEDLQFVHESLEDELGAKNEK